MSVTRILRIDWVPAQVRELESTIRRRCQGSDAQLVDFCVDLGTPKRQPEEYPALNYFRAGKADALLIVCVPSDEPLPLVDCVIDRVLAPQNFIEHRFGFWRSPSRLRVRRFVTRRQHRHQITDKPAGCCLAVRSRGARRTEPPYVDMRQLLQGIRDELAGALAGGVPVAFVGHSFGSVLAFEAAAQLVATGREWPVHLFVSACASPRRGSALEHSLGFGKQAVDGTLSSDTLSDAELLNIRRRAGAQGRGADKLDDDELAAFIVPTLRADLRVLRTYTHEQRRILLIPITAIIGRQDPMIDAKHITDWMGHTAASFSARIICADHRIRYGHMWSIISSQLATLLDIPPGG